MTLTDTLEFNFTLVFIRNVVILTLENIVRPDSSSPNLGTSGFFLQLKPILCQIKNICWIVKGVLQLVE